MTHRVIKKLKPFKKTEDFLQKSKISYGTQSNQNIEAFKKNRRF